MPDILCEIRFQFISRKRFAGRCARGFRSAPRCRLLLFFCCFQHCVRTIRQVFQRLARSALKGIDKAFESYQRSRRGAGKPLKNLAYCTDAVLEAAEEQQQAAAGSTPKTARAAASEAFSRDELKTYFAKNVGHLKRAAEQSLPQRPEMAVRLKEIAESLESSGRLLDAPGTLDLEDLERRLTILDEKIHALLTSHAPEELMLRIRREMDGQLAMYRRKMRVEQLTMVEKQYVQKRMYLLIQNCQPAL